ncbi:flagellar transcriptional activator [Salmonella bongori]|nr:flagellar transcriptional activator [Salmonella bongori]
MPGNFYLKTGLCNGVDAVIKAYRLYLEQCPQPPEGPLLALTPGMDSGAFCRKRVARIVELQLLWGKLYHPCAINQRAALRAVCASRHPAQ